MLYSHANLDYTNVINTILEVLFDMNYDMESDMRFITIDLEGDANVQQCKEFFKEGNHFDKDTIPWCISFYDGEDLNTIVCKLPEDTRPIYKDGVVVGRTRSYHSKDTKVPSNCIECRNLKEWSDKVYSYLKIFKDRNIPVIFKAYPVDNKLYYYDRDVLELTLKRFELDTSVLSIVKGIKIQTPKTKSQIKKGEYIDNQRYLELGIEHNREDVIELYKAILNSL